MQQSDTCVTSIPAQNLEGALNAFDPQKPLTGLEPYYVYRGSGVNQLIQDLLVDRRSSTKTLFTGHRGSGKTTELSRLARALEARYFIVYFDIDEVLDVADSDYKDVLLMLGIKLYQVAKQRSIRYER